MRIEELKSKNAIYFENISEGFKKYRHEVVKMEIEDLRDYIADYHEVAYTDFYYFKIDDRARAKVNAVLNNEEIGYIAGLASEDIIFKLDEKLLDIVAKLNYMEMLFSTIYIVGDEPITLWGNYNKEYVIFKNKNLIIVS